MVRCGEGVGKVHFLAVVVVGRQDISALTQPVQKFVFAMTITAEAAVELESDHGQGVSLHDASHAFEHLPLGTFDIDFAEIHPRIGAEERIKPGGVSANRSGDVEKRRR